MKPLGIETASKKVLKVEDAVILVAYGRWFRVEGKGRIPNLSVSIRWIHLPY